MLALVTCAAARGHDPDLPLLTNALPEAVVVEWDDGVVDWAGFDAVFLRSTWDYADRRDEFLAWAAGVAEVTDLWNPPPIIEWSTDKHYLATLAERGVAVVPTTFAAPGCDVAEELDLDADLVVKPAIGAGSRGVRRTNSMSDALDHIARLHAAGHTAMVQPYLADVDEQGETGLVYLAGEFSHAFEKDAILSRPIEWAGGLFAQETFRARVPSAAERDLGDALVASFGPTAYARIDLLPTADGPVVLELELVEPSLFLETDPAAAERCAAAFRSLAR